MKSCIGNEYNVTESITATVPNLIAFDLVAVQPMDNKIGKFSAA